jgi:hypothetical protein
VRADGRWFVGPDNGLFNAIARRARAVQWWDIAWRPSQLSATFHGRDLFAPVAARLARGELPPGIQQEVRKRIRPDWPEDLARIVYIDHYGNAMTGLRAAVIPSQAMLEVKGQRLARAYTFSDVAPGQAFWYENANGLAEIAVNRGSVSRALRIEIGDVVTVLA